MNFVINEQYLFERVKSVDWYRAKVAWGHMLNQEGNRTCELP